MQFLISLSSSYEITTSYTLHGFVLSLSFLILFGTIGMESKSFDNVEYWNRRYSIQSEPYDWYQDADTTSNLLLKYFEKLQTEKEDLELLITGCGTSQLGPVLYSKGCKNITNIDISPVVIEVQKKRYASVPIDFLQRDASKFSDFPNGYFDVIVDKVITRNPSSLIEILYIKH